MIREGADLVTPAATAIIGETTLGSVTAAGVVVAAISLLGLLVRQINPWRKQTADSEQKFRDDLIKREAALVEREAALSERVAKLEKSMGRQQQRHNAERALDRHRLNNVTQCFDALLLLLKANPEKAAEAVVLIEEMRAKQMRAEAEEKAIIRAAEITADEGECDHDGN